MSKINNKSLISYSLLAFCLSFIGLPIYIYLPSYYANNFSISLQSIALILLATRLIDTIQDPIIGILSDKFSSLRRVTICCLSPFLGIAFLLLFYPLKIFNIELWLTIFLIITYSLFSIIYINYQSYAVNLTNDYHLKTKVISYRETSFIVGIIFAAAAPSILFKYFSEITSFLIIGAIYFVLISYFAIIFYKKAPKSDDINKKSGDILLVLKNPNLRKYFAIFLLNSISSSIPAVLILFFVEEILGAKDLAGLFLILYFCGLLFGVALWTKISKILGDKILTFIISISFTIVTFSWCFFLKEGDILPYCIICILSGVGFGGDLTLTSSIITDVIQKDNLEDNKTTIFGIMNFIVKISLTLASSTLIYFIGEFKNDPKAQQEFISFSYALLPMIFRILAMVALYKIFKNTRLLEKKML